MKHISLLLSIIFLLFEQPVTASTRYAIKPVMSRQHALFAAVPHHNVWHRLRHLINPDDSYTDTSPGVFSVACAAFAAVGFIAFGLTATPALLAVVFVGAVAATVFGAVGLRRHKRGFAIAGLTLGLLEIVGGIILLALLM